jgi:hypothetical protein
MAQQGCELCQKRNHGLLNYASLNSRCAYCSDFLIENLEEVPVAEIYRRSSDISSTPELKAYKGTKEQLGSFDKMWNMLKKEAEKNPKDLIITIIDTEYMTRDSLKRDAAEK